MTLSQPTPENIDLMLEEIKEKLGMVNVDAMQAGSFDTDKYEDLVFIHKTVMKRNHISSNEMEAIASELGALRK